MESLIVSKIICFCRKVASGYSESVVGRIVEKIYLWCSALWQKGLIISLFRKERAKVEQSFVSRLIYSPFTFLEYINKKVGDRLCMALEKSAIIGICVDFAHNMLALSTRFLGILFLAFSVPVWLKGTFNYAAVISVIGLIFALVNVNLTDFFARSVFVRKILSLFGLTVTYDFYETERISKGSVLIFAAAVGLLCGCLPLKIGLLCPIALAAVGTVLIYPIVGVFAAFFVAPFVPTMILAGLCVLSFASVCIKAVTEKNFKFRRDSVGTGLGIFLLFMLAASVFSFSPKKSILVWGMYFIFICFYYVTVSTVRTRMQLFSLMKVFAVAGLCVSIFGILQYIFGWNTNNAWIDESMFEEATMRAYSTMENPNVLGEYLLLLIPISAALFIERGIKIPERFFYLLTFFAAALCMIFTQSRGCWLGLILSVAVFVTFYNGRLWALLPIFAAALIFVMPQTMIDRMLSVGNMEDSSTSYRVFIWMGTFEMMKDFWIGGIGMGEGAFRKIYPLYSYNGIVAPHSHNTFLQLLTEGGIGALFIFVGLMIDFLRNMGNLFRKSKEKSREAFLALALGSAVCGFLLQSMFDYTFYNYRMMAMFFMVLAVGMALVHIEEEQDVQNN